MVSFAFNVRIFVGHLSWSATGNYLAGASDSVINIWVIKKSKQFDGCDWFIEHQTHFITSMCWPKAKPENDGDNEHLLVGRIDGETDKKNKKIK